MNGIGASLEVLQPFVDALDPRRTVIRFDVPGVGGSPRPVVPYNLATFSPVVAGMLDRLGLRRAGRRPRAVLGRGAGPALRRPAPEAGAGGWCSPPPATGSLMVPAHPRVLAKMLTPRRHRDPEYARSIAGEIYGGTMRTHPERGRAGAALGDPARPAARLLLPAGRQHGLEQPAVPAADPAADAGRRRGRRPDHPGGQRADHGAAAPRRPAAPLRRRAHRADHRGDELAPVIEEFLDG